VAATPREKETLPGIIPNSDTKGSNNNRVVFLDPQYFNGMLIELMEG